MPEAPGAYVLSGPSHFVASHVLLLDEPAGTLVWIPNRHTLFVAPAAPGAEAALAPLVARAFRDGPGSLTGETLHPFD